MSDTTRYTFDLKQGENDDGSDYGYIGDGDGGYFFTWKPTLEATLATLEADEVDEPDFSEDDAREALSAKIAGRFS